MHCQHAPSTHQLLAWLNKHTRSRLPSAQSSNSLSNGVSFLVLLSELHPSMDNHSIIFDPSEPYEVSHNFRLLQASLKKLGVSCELNISQLASGSSHQTIKLLSLLYNSFESHLSGEYQNTARAMEGNHKVTKIQRPSKIVAPKLSKQSKSEIDLVQLGDFYTRNKLQSIKNLLNSKENAQKKLKIVHNLVYTQEVNFQQNCASFQVERHDKFQTQSLNEDYDEVFLSKKKVSEVNHLRINLDNSQAQNISNIESAKSIQKMLKCKQYDIPAKQRSTIIRFLTKSLIPLIQSLSKNKKFQSYFREVRRIFQNFPLSITKFHYLFFGVQQYCGSSLQFYTRLKVYLHNQELKIDTTMARKMLRQSYSCYIKQTNFVKSTLKSCYKKDNILLFLKHLPNIEILSQMKLQMSQLFTYKQFEKYKQQMKCIFWSDHKMVQIAFEVKYIYSQQIKGKSVYHQRKYLFNISQQVKNEFNIKNLMKKYRHLRDLLTKNVSCQNLKDFVRILLEIKCDQVHQQFLDIYNVVIGQILNISFDQVRRHSDRFDIIQKIVNKLRLKGKRLNQYFMSYGFEDNLDGTMELLKVTVYCFLAEMHNFQYNEFYCSVFDIQNLERKNDCL